MTGRDRIGDRSGRRAFFGPPTDHAPPDHPPAGRERPDSVRGAAASGRRALFSGPEGRPAPAGRAGRSGRVVVECRTCLVRARVSLTSTVFCLFPSLWLPTRPWPVLMTCPHCGRRSWCRIDWTGRQGGS